MFLQGVRVQVNGLGGVQVNGLGEGLGQRFGWRFRSMVWVRVQVNGLGGGSGQRSCVGGEDMSTVNHFFHT